MNKQRFFTFFFVLVFTISSVYAQSKSPESAFRIARLKYSGGGDWYNDPSSIPNLHKYLQDNINILTAKDEDQVSLLDEELFAHPFLFMTGHGNISFSDKEVIQLRKYLTSGGFLYADDDYGMDEHFKREMNKVFPNKKLLPIPFNHLIYQIYYKFDNGLPKIHEHDGGVPKGFGYFHKGRLVVFYSFNTNISDGWADPDVHKDSPKTRDRAFKVGTNIVLHALLN
jgi:hypothetical protein